MDRWLSRRVAINTAVPNDFVGVWDGAALAVAVGGEAAGGQLRGGCYSRPPLTRPGWGHAPPAKELIPQPHYDPCGRAEA